MTLYNLRTDGDHYRITKFTNDLDVESSYLTSHAECECPAGHRPTCRHRQMLPNMLANDLLDSGGFYDFESQTVLMPVTDETDPEYGELESQRGLPASSPRPTFTEGTVGITQEELVAEIPTYEQAIDHTEGHAEMTAPDATPHPTIGKIDRRI